MKKAKRSYVVGASLMVVQNYKIEAESLEAAQAKAKENAFCLGEVGTLVKETIFDCEIDEVKPMRAAKR